MMIATPLLHRLDWHDLIGHVEDSLTVLERAFGAPFQLWVDDSGWKPLAPTAEGNRCSQIARILEELEVRDRPLVTNAPESPFGSLVLIPLDHLQQIDCFAVAEFDSKDRELLGRLAEVSSLALRQTQQIECASERLGEYAMHVSRDSEQLIWLQALAEHIEICDPRNGFDDVSHHVLPALRELIVAESILIYSVPSTSSSEETAADVEPSCVCRVGRSDVSDADCLRLIRERGDVARIHPAVGNCTSESGYFAEFAGLRSFILVPVETNDFHCGWLLALNRQPPLDGDVSSGQGPSEREFGTIEGNLLKSAGIMLAAHARNAHLFREKEALMIGIVRALINAMDAKDSYTFGHSDRVALMTRRIAEQLGFDDETCERVFLTGLLHDIGKIGVPDSVLQKPGKLTDEEFELIKKHPTIGRDILQHLDQLDYVLGGVLHHHESYDGRGYPHQLVGDAIPMVARIVAVADAYDAMTSSRPYRHAMPKEKAEKILRENAGVQWDAGVVEAFFAAIDDIHEICESSRIQSTDFAPTESETGGSRSQPDDLVSRAVTATSQRRRVGTGSQAPS